MKIIICLIIFVATPTFLFAGGGNFIDDCVTCPSGSGWAVDVVIITDEDENQQYLVFLFGDGIAVIPRIKTEVHNKAVEPKKK